MKIEPLYIFQDKNAIPIGFEEKPIHPMIGWAGKDWHCALDNKYLGYFHNEQLFTTKDFLIYYVDKAIKNKNQTKTQIIDSIVKIHNLTHKLNGSRYSYPINVEGSHKYTINSQKSEEGINHTDPENFFKLSKILKARNEKEVKEIKKSYAELLSKIDEIDSLWREVDEQLKKFKIKSDTPIAQNKDKSFAVYYYQLKEIFPGSIHPNRDKRDKSCHIDVLNAIRLHDYKIDSNYEWVAKNDLITPDFEILKDRNVKYLHDFSFKELQGKWFINIDFEMYNLKQDRTDIKLLSNIVIDKNQLIASRKKSNFDKRVGHGMLAELENGKILKLLPMDDGWPDIIAYCNQANTRLEKYRLGLVIKEPKTLMNSSTINKI